MECKMENNETDVIETLKAQEQGSFTQDEYLQFVQMKRIRFIDSIEKAVETEEGLATLDPDRQSNYLAALRDIEKQVLTKEKMENDKTANAAATEAIAAMIVEQHRRLSSERAKRFQEEKLGITKTIDQLIPDPETAIPKKSLLKGETEIGDHIENFREYKLRTGHHIDQDPFQQDPDA